MSGDPKFMTFEDISAIICNDDVIKFKEIIESETIHNTESLYALPFKSKSIKCAKLVLDYKATGNINDNTYINTSYILESACQSDNVEMLQLIIDGGVAISDKDLLPCFEVEEIISNTDITQILLGLVKDVNYSSKDRDGDSFLRRVSLAGNAFLAQTLLERGAARGNRSRVCEEALVSATMRGHIDVVKVLLNWDANGVRIPYYTLKESLQSAVIKGHFDIVRSLVAYGVDIDSLNHALRQCIQHDQVGIAEFLLENGAEINAVTMHKRTPLTTACMRKKTEPARLLLGRGADPNTRDGRLQYPLEAAISEPDIIEILLEHGADPNKHFVYDSTALILASWPDQDSGIKRQNIINHKVLTLLLRHGADPNLTTCRDGCTALMIAAACLHINSVILLLEYGADVSQVNRNGKSVLDILGDASEYTEIIELCKQYIDTNRPEAKPILK